MTGRSKISRLLQRKYFSLLGTLSGALYTCRAAFAPSFSTRLSAARYVANMSKDVRSIWMPTYSVYAPMPISFDIFSTTSRLISSFGSLVTKTILIGSMLAMFAMASTVAAASRLAATIKGRFTTNPSSGRDSKQNPA